MVDRSPPQISFHSGMSETAPRATGMKGFLFFFVHRKDTFFAIDAFMLLCFFHFHSLAVALLRYLCINHDGVVRKVGLEVSLG